ncbi:MAG: hypothetical protein IJA97_06905 [Clostridia bacterium]|nr:hypothetical protein [Clostridia bacterium]
MDEKETKVPVKERESKLSLGEIFKTLREGLIWIIIITVLFAGLGVVYALAYQKTSYTARVDAYIFTDKLYTEDEDGLRSEGISEHVAYQYCAMLVPQCKPVFTSNEVMNEVSKAGIKLRGGLNFIVNEESPYFSITYTYSQHGGNVSAIKHEVAKTLNDYVSKSIETINTATIEDANGNTKIKYGYLSEKIFVYSDASPADVTAATGRTKTVFLAALVGLVVSVIFVLVKNLLSDAVSTKEQVEILTENQIIATIDISTNLDNREKTEKKKGDEEDA